MDDALLQLKGLSVAFNDDSGLVEVVSSVNLEVYPGETVGIVGESGCGKSVTSLAAMGLIPSPPGKITGGEIWFNGRNLLREHPSSWRNIRGREMAMIFQEPMSSLDPAFTVGSQVDEAILFHESIPKGEARARSIELLQAVGIPKPEHRYNEYPHHLSGGMRQRVMTAMALACSPKLIIADEPTTALDVTMQAQILEMLKELRTKINTSILLITHDMGVVAEMCERVVVMYAGQVVESASCLDLFDRTAHPYTRGLLKSIPGMSGSQTRLYSIAGNVPAPGSMPPGCRFEPRCQYAIEQCRRETPVLRQIGPHHSVRCWQDGFGESGEEA
ncbi:MAG TPA: ABC transporter ATP-binding protein [Desulfotomaculum sp.]|nr:MAG: peptide ABC transporter ATP-binding protein [Desulfotomaculum sp. BICA1-6]HBX22277.1 ABC transporter ATP-binding protein [Desulfotomaculum sp.]